jgi:hypothetical protein
MKRLAIIWGGSAAFVLVPMLARCLLLLGAASEVIKARDWLVLVAVGVVGRAVWLGLWTWLSRPGTRRVAVRRLAVLTLIAACADVLLFVIVQAAHAQSSAVLAACWTVAVALSALLDGWFEAAAEGERLSTLPRRRSVVWWAVTWCLVSGTALSFVLRDRSAVSWFDDEWLYWHLFGWPAASWVATVVRVAWLKTSLLTSASPPAEGAAASELRRFVHALGGALSAALLVVGCCLAAVSAHENKVRRGWNLVPVLVTDSNASLAPLDESKLAMRSIPEQFVTTSVLKPNHANLAVHETLLGPVVPGAPILWGQFVKGDERCAARVEAAARSVPIEQRRAAWRLVDAWYGESR